ncbi:hypothetical protein FrEUN1fDRAFT_3769 [Parafrankia sp. EUN1f]|nr:hypothetical protein [Parafrankia sp. EUN1f]EFC83097.1 hypothetical protein FrEUN1fDRAFT_3769 [Parafrankia sp. EUN1f]
MAKYEHELSAFDDLGLSDVDRDDCLTYLLSFVQANARAARESASVAAGPDGDDTRWWARVGPLLARVLDEQRYPRARAASARPPARHTAAPTTLTTPTASASPAFSTAWHLSSTGGDGRPDLLARLGAGDTGGVVADNGRPLCCQEGVGPSVEAR